jgi:hypothetical protein
MGNKYSVLVLRRPYEGAPYDFILEWGGESFAKALIELWLARRMGYGCVRLECRP